MLLLGAMLVSMWTTATNAEQVTYESDIRPILKKHCFQCHGERGTVEANLDLRLRRFAVNGGDSGPAIVPGEVGESLLLERVIAGEMPPAEDKRLSEEEISTIRDWVEQGAPTLGDEPESLDDQYFTVEEKNWWAFRPVQRPTMPKLEQWSASPIDAFLLGKIAQLAAQTGGEPLGFSPQADRPTRIRRLYLDMLGLPPSPEQVERFVNDGRPDAWARLVDQVLSSPQYGERWARHWLDTAGYADSEGYTEDDRVRDHAFRYRDYVIQAFNENKPYSDFIVEQLAGDELVDWPRTAFDPENSSQLAATGFLRMAPDGTASGGIDQNLARNQVVADTLQIVSSTVMGVTIQCAQCHDHRYDPISQKDYYQLRAIFEPSLNWKDWRTPANRQITLYTDADRKIREDIEGRAKEVDAERKAKVDIYIAKTLEHELLMVADEIQEPLRLAFLAKAAERTDEQKKLLEDHTNIGKISAGSLYLYDRRREARAKDLEQRRQVKLAAFLENIKKQALADLDEPTRDAVTAAWNASADQRTEDQKQLVSTHAAVGANAENMERFDADGAAEVERYTTAAAEIRSYRIATELKKFDADAKAVRDTIPKEYFLRIASEVPDKVPATFVFHRGDHDQPKEQVEPRGLSILNAPEIPSNDGSEHLATSGRRLAFANYLTHGKHPLVARAFVNRVWAHHFGRGIVATTGDFGFLGERPTHPELLDWLASEFVASGWDVKRLQRSILMSDAYQQTAVASETVVTVDPENRWLGRWPLRRLESETVRDAVLSVAGKLNTKMFGDPVPVMEDGVGQIILGKESLDGERKPTAAIPLQGEEFRRSVYVQVRRSMPFGVLESFDLPDLAPNCPERASSTVATQSLMMMNSNFAIALSEVMADRLIAEHPKEPAEQLRRGWQLAFGTQPSDRQLAKSKQFLEKQHQTFANNDPTKKAEADYHRLALATYCQALLGSNAFLYIE
jgi:mono/diheme cytochrome c family protein